MARLTRCFWQHALIQRTAPSHQFRWYSTGGSNVPDTPSQDKQKRIPLSEKAGQWASAFSLFQPGQMFTADVVAMMQSNLNLKTLKVWWARKQLKKALADQQFVSTRLEVLGCDLAAAHFIVHRGGAVKFKKWDEWFRKDSEGRYSLPSKYNPDFQIEAIDASNTALMYEGLENFRRLYDITWLSCSGCQHIDDWCLDRICGEFQDSLEYLDLSNCPRITERGLGALYKSRKIKTLRIFNLPAAKNLELVCLMLEDLYPNIDIQGVDYMKGTVLKTANIVEGAK